MVSSTGIVKDKAIIDVSETLIFVQNGNIVNIH